MKVAFVVPGGVDRSGTHRVIPCLLWLIERLGRVHRVHVFALRQEPRPSRYPLLGAAVHNIGARPRRLRAVAAILAEHRREPFDVLHAVWGPGPGVVAAVAGRITGRPVVTHLTGGDLAALPDIGFGARRRWQGRAWLRLAVAGAARLTVPSSAMQRSAAALGIAAERLPYGVAADRWPPLPPRPRRTGAPARLLHVGSLNRVKDQGTLLRAARALRESGVVFRLDVVGEDTLGGAVQRMAGELGVGDVVTFHGFVPHPRLRPLVEAADLLLVSSRHEADPIVLLEAAMAGVPTVGTAVGHIADWAPDAAVAVPVGDAVALARETAALLADEERRLRVAAAAQERAQAEDADRTARRVLEIYQEVCSRGDAPPVGGTRSPAPAGRRPPPPAGRDPRALPARDAYRLWAPRYEAENAVTLLEDRTVAELTPPADGRALLDAGCGTARRLQPRAGAGLALGVDLVPEMLAAGRALRPAGPPLVAADVTALPVRDGVFDLVWCRLVAGHVPALGALYRELARVSRPGAAVVVTDFHPAAARAGHERTFRDGSGRVWAIEHHVHEPEDHERAAGAAGLALDRRVDAAVGPEVREFYERAGALDRYEAQRGLPLVLALRFTRGAGGAVHGHGAR